MTTAPARVTAAMFSRWIRLSGVSRGISTSRRRSFSITSAQRWIRFRAVPWAMHARLAPEQGAMSAAGASDDPDANGAVMSLRPSTVTDPLPAGPIQGGSGGMIWPVNGTVTSPFGMRWGRLHAGIDIAVPAGTPIRAAKSGSIVLAAPTSGYGNYTCIDHGGGLSTCYAHQSSYAITSGSVSQGDVIGYVGCTGSCYGDHLHFEVRVNGAPVDPMGYL